MNDTILKLIVAAVVFLSTLLFSLLPACLFTWIKRRDQPKACSTSSNLSRVRCTSPKIIISCITCFGGGVFFGASLLELLPHVIHDINTMLKKEFNYDNEHTKDYPIGEFLIALGFLTVLFVEQTILSLHSPTIKLISVPKKNLSLTGLQNNNEVTTKNCEQEHFSLIITPSIHATTEQDIPLNEAKDDISTCSNHLTTTRNLLMILSLVIHSFFEGVALGSLSGYQTIVQLCLAILVHKSIISFSVGLKLISSTNKRWTYLACTIFSSATPIGLLIMLSMHELLPENSFTKIFSSIISALACGTFFYITFFDILPHELDLSSASAETSLVLNRYRLIKTFSILFGFLCTAVLLFITK